MTLSTSLISGLASGFDWRTMIDQLIAIERRRIDLVEDQKTEYESKLKILQAINTKLLTFKTRAESLASSNAFNVFTTSLTTNSTTYNASDFLSVTTRTSAAPGTHTITMNANSSVAQARTLSSRSFTTYDTDLDLVGEFVINGRAVSVADGDDLLDIRDKINNLNTGTNATGVTASILTVSSSNYRLVLTSDNTGEDAFTIFDASSDTQNILSSGLGFTDGDTSVKNYISNGVQSEAFSSASQSVSSMLGITIAQTGTTVSIGSVDNITIDLSKSLTELASDINAAVNGTNISASVVSTTENNVTTYRLKIENTTGFTDHKHVLETLGILDGDQGNVQEVHQGTTELRNDTDVLLDSDNTGDDDLTLINMTDLRIAAGTSAGVATNDNIRVIGTKSDGTSVDATGTVGSSFTTVADFVDWVDTQFTGGGTPTNNVTVRFDDGLIKITDDNAGDSQLSITIVAYNNVGEGKLDFGTVSATTEGYTMEVQSGQDANIIIDGTAITSSSNIIDDVISGVTLNLKTVEAGKKVYLTISRDYDTIKSSVQGLLDAYNDIILAINEQFYYDEETQTAGLLQGDSTLSSIRSSLQNIVVSSITGLSSTMNALSLIGINSKIDYSDPKNNGMLYIDNDDFMDALEDNFNALRRIFVAEGSTTDGDVEYISHTNDTVAGNYLVNITTVATQATVTGSVDLSDGIGASDIETLTITQGSKIGAITLDGATGENGSSIDNIVNAINSELDTEYAQSVMGNVKNTTDAEQTTAITNTTKWSEIFTNGEAAGLADEDKITFSGHRSNGTEVTGSYTISDADMDTVQGLITAIEAAYNYEVSAAINTNGYLVVTDNTNGNSNLDIIINEPTGETKKLDFGYVTTSNLVGSVRNTTGGGAAAIAATTEWESIDGAGLSHNDIIKFTGYTVDGAAVEGSHQVDVDGSGTVDHLLSAIEDAFNAKDGASVTAEIQDGRIVVKDGTTNSTLDLTIFEPADKELDFGTFSGGVSGRYSIGITASDDGDGYLVLTHDDYGSGATFSVSQSGSDLGLGSITAGVDVEGKINEEDATGSGQFLRGDAPGTGETTSVDGLTIKYTGAETGAQGYVKITMGVGELFDRVLYNITNEADGYLDFRLESMGYRIDDLEDDIDEMEDRLNRKMEVMIKRFVAMELALSKIQQQSNWLAGQISASFSGWRW